MENPKDISNPTTALEMALELMAKVFQLNNTTLINNNQRSSSNPCYSQIAQLGHLVGKNAVQNQGIQNVGNQNRLSTVPRIANQHGNGNVVAAQAQGDSNGINGNPISSWDDIGFIVTTPLMIGFSARNVEMESDIENMTISEYLEYEAVKERRLWDDVRSGRSPTNYNEADDIMIEDIEQIRKIFNIPNEIDEIVKPLIPEPIHTTPPSDDYVAPTTKLILDELLKEFEDEILNVTMVDDEADFNPTKD
nr:hypothetical protein [Tanacetum cinerariifolium]